MDRPCLARCLRILLGKLFHHADLYTHDRLDYLFLIIPYRRKRILDLFVLFGTCRLFHPSVFFGDKVPAPIVCSLKVRDKACEHFLVPKHVLALSHNGKCRPVILTARTPALIVDLVKSLPLKSDYLVYEHILG